MLCHVCDSQLHDTDKRFVKSVGTKAYFHVVCSACDMEYACDETGTVVRFQFGAPTRTSSLNGD